MTAMSFSLRQRRNPHKRKILLRVSGGRWWRAMSFSLRQRGNPHEEKILLGGGRWRSPGRVSQNDILLNFQWGFFLRQRGNPQIPLSSPSPTRKFSSWGFPLWQRETLMATSKDSHEFFSSSKRKSSRGKTPRGGGDGREQWVFLFVKEEFLTRKKSSCGREVEVIR